MTHYVIEATTVVDADRAFLGLWTGAIGDWKSCGALIVGSLRSNGSGKTATITYIEGPPPWQSGTGRTAPGDLLEWKRIDRDAAVVNRGELYFDNGGRNFFFKFAYDNTLRAILRSNKGAEFQAQFFRDLNSLPPTRR